MYPMLCVLRTHNIGYIICQMLFARIPWEKGGGNLQVRTARKFILSVNDVNRIRNLLSGFPIGFWVAKYMDLCRRIAFA